MYMGLNVKYSLFLSEFHGTNVFSRQIFDKYPNSRSQEDPPNGTQIVHAEMRMDRRTLRHVEVYSLFFFRNSANASKH